MIVHWENAHAYEKAPYGAQKKEEKGSIQTHKKGKMKPFRLGNGYDS